MIRYAREAQLARAHLLRAYNDLLVFVEDETCQNMHVRMISNILAGAGKITNVFPLYSRRNVLEAALADEGTDSRKIFIVDGDLDQLSGIDVPLNARLHRIGAYSVENLLISERSLLELACECSTELDIRELTRSVQFDSVKRTVVRALLPLFEVYAVVAKCDLSIKTVSFSVARLYETRGKNIYLLISEIRKRISDVRRQIVGQIGWQAFKLAVLDVRRNGRVILDLSNVISGKDYLLPMVHAYLRVVLNFRDSFDGLRVRLARHFDPDTAPELRDFVRGALSRNYRLSGSGSASS